MFHLKRKYFDEAGGDGDAGGGAGGEGGTGAEGGAGGTVDWMGGLSEEDKAFVANKGWKDPAHVVQGYRNVEKLARGNPDKLVRIPEDGASEDEWNQYHAKLGRPDTPDGYELPEGENADKDFQKWAKETFHKLGLPAGQAKALVEAYDAMAAERVSQAAEQQQLRNAEDDRSLRKEWGARYEVNEKLAGRAAQALGVTPEQVDALEQALGYAGVIKMFHGLASKISEDAFVGGASNNSNLMTPAQATQKIAELKSDAAFRTKLVNGDLAAKRQMDELHRMAYGKTG